MDRKRMANAGAGEGPTTEREIVSKSAPSRREVLRAGTTVAVGAGAMQLLAGDAGAQGRDQGRDRDAATLERLIVAIRADDINTMPLTNAVSTVVSHAHAGNIDAVFIAGEVRKWAGRLVGHDLAKVRERVRQSRDHLFAQRGYKLDILA
jgi:hypothetical protein